MFYLTLHDNSRNFDTIVDSNNDDDDDDGHNNNNNNNNNSNNNNSNNNKNKNNGKPFLSTVNRYAITMVIIITRKIFVGFQLMVFENKCTFLKKRCTA